jgi:hypothetical protein
MLNPALFQTVASLFKFFRAVGLFPTRYYIRGNLYVINWSWALYIFNLEATLFFGTFEMT